MRLPTSLIALTLFASSSLAIAVQPKFSDSQIVMKPAVEESYTPQTSNKPTLADLLTIENRASIFYSYARELELSQGLANKDTKLTLFVPTNKAVMNLARKPHQDPPSPDGDISISEEEFDRRTRSNVERWVGAHIVPAAPIALSGSHQTLYPTKSLELTSKSKSESPSWKDVVLDGGVRITSHKEASNGDLYIIDGTVNVDELD